MNSYLERLQQELEEAMADASVGDLSRAPAGKWNAAQILEHLFLTYRNTNRGIAKSLEQGAPLATRATMKHRLSAFVVLNLGYLPNGRQAPDRVVPQGKPPEEAHRAVLPELEKMARGFDECERKFSASAKIMDHPFLGPLTAAQWRKFHWVHGRHHARQIRERMGRP